MTLLRLDNVGKSYGGVAALRGLSFTVAAGEIVGLMGANGAGKTTAFSVIAGTQRPTSAKSGSTARASTASRPMPQPA